MQKVKKKRTKKYKPRELGDVTMRALPWKVDLIMAPFTDLIHEIETKGTIDIDNKGTPVFLDKVYGEIYPVVDAAKGFIEMWEIFERRKNVSLSLTPLSQFISRLQYSSPITEIELKAAKLSIENIRKAIYSMSWKEAIELAHDASIKFEIEKRCQV